MSNEVLPSFPGLSPSVKWTPVHNTIVRESATRLETRTTYEAYPVWQIALKYELLRAGRQHELQDIAGFFMRHGGRRDDFLFEDERDFQTADSVFGVGDGVTRTFRLWREWGGSTAPISAVKSLLMLSVGGTEITAGYVLDANAGKIAFDAAPADGAVLRWGGEYYWRVRFANDDVEFEKFMHQWWQNGKLELRTVKTK
ncbi:DUF2460 domain-containing protein [Methylobacillus flagellatus]|uniref:DUF2460 domain-containing protein n=1 Tax=Methylobacillus flagellatus TaxID=405 RepID=UPI00285392B2|nr:DUF2460 domain-containing protein [Methylobacillus flagellatus]MDR5170732.1 DUF2460 domain-containing protein [Methylobacillus flagellatus]